MQKQKNVFTFEANSKVEQKSFVFINNNAKNIEECFLKDLNENIAFCLEMTTVYSNTDTIISQSISNINTLYEYAHYDYKEKDFLTNDKWY